MLVSPAFHGIYWPDLSGDGHSWDIMSEIIDITLLYVWLSLVNFCRSTSAFAFPEPHLLLVSVWLVFDCDHDPPFWVRNVTSGDVSLHWINSPPSPSFSCFTRWCHGRAGCFKVCPKCWCFCRYRLRELSYTQTHACTGKQVMSVFGCCVSK